MRRSEGGHAAPTNRPAPPAFSFICTPQALVGCPWTGLSLRPRRNLRCGAEPVAVAQCSQRDFSLPPSLRRSARSQGRYHEDGQRLFDDAGVEPSFLRLDKDKCGKLAPLRPVAPLPRPLSRGPRRMSRRMRNLRSRAYRPHKAPRVCGRHDRGARQIGGERRNGDHLSPCVTGPSMKRPARGSPHLQRAILVGKAVEFKSAEAAAYPSRAKPLIDLGFSSIRH
jgi:hypothetical protein